MQRFKLWTRLAWLEPIWIALLAPSLLFPGRFWTMALHPLLILLLLLFWPVRRVAYGRFSVRTPLDWSVALIVLWLPMAIWASVEPERSWAGVGILCLGVASYFALVNWPPARRRPQAVAWILAIIGLGLILLGPMLITTPIPLFQRLGIESTRVQIRTSLGETLNPNVWAGSLLLMIPLYAAGVVTPGWSRFAWGRWIGALFCLLAVGLLFVTDSRGAYMGLAASLLTLLMLRWPRAVYGIVPLVLLGLIVLTRIDVRLLFDYLFADVSLSGWSGRPEIWMRAVSAIQDFPWTGIGFGLYNRVIPVLYPYFVVGDSIEHAHNLFLQIGVDMGVPGLVAYIAIIVGAFAMASRFLRRRPWQISPDGGGPQSASSLRQDSLNWALAAGLVSALVAMLVHGVVDAVIWGTKLAFLPWLFFALATNLRLSSLRRRRKRGRRSSDNPIVQNK